MPRFILLLFLVFFVLISSAQNSGAASVKRPKLVVGIVVDQMRWDYLYRFYDRYAASGGFKRLINQGFSCENTMIPYAPTVTACGHTCIYTGSVPAIHGITGNDWWDHSLNRIVYCTEDNSVQATGSNTTEGQMSPRNLLVTTIGDELRLATNFRSKVIGLALKDRAAILPAGHSADAAYWYDSKKGDWITSTYYLNKLPKWVKEMNEKKLVDQYYAGDWSTLYPLNTYMQNTKEEEPYKYKPLDKDNNQFPYNLRQYVGKNYGVISVTPYGNSFTFDMAKAAITGEELGADSVTDLLTISLSSPDYIGHTFGPNSVEAEDGFLRLDKDLGDFLDFLDKRAGEGNYVVFLSADHGAAHVPAFLKQHKIPAGNINTDGLTEKMNGLLKEKFGIEKTVTGIINYQVYLDHNLINNAKADENAIQEWIIGYLLQQPGISKAFVLDDMGKLNLNAEIKEMIINGYYPSRSGDIQLIFEPQWIDGFLNGGTTHGVWNPYDAHIPLIWYGWNIMPGKTNRETYMTDIAATIAAMLHIQMPSGCVGHVIEEVLR
ncbi:MAG TPA: alkaline phosphatase family protein [Panacibacter sp.]|nr:alkaline phosphatase family protein [Panacibacter sp.]